MTALLLVLAAQTVTGTVTYEDRDYTNAGFTGGITARPVAMADVDILQSGTSTVLRSGTTDPAGNFSIGPIAGGVSVFARIYASHAGDRIHASVRNSLGADAVYTVVTADLDTSMSLAFPAILITIAGGAAPAFNIYDCAVKSFLYQATVDALLPLTPPTLKIYWQANSATGTFFTRTLDALFLIGTSADPDEYDDDIILHEIGHWVAYHFSKDNTLGGPHAVTDQLDPRTAWSEGWAHYWSAAVRRHFPAEYPSPETQVDNLGGGGFQIFNIEMPSFSLLAVGATNELAVAAVLWDITDAVDEPPFDTLNGNEIQVWRAVAVQIPLRSVITLEDFREGLGIETSGILGFMAAVTGDPTTPGIMKDRGILYYADSSESNDSTGTAAILPTGLAGLAQQTFFASADPDFYKITLIPGILIAETFNLGDGADTRLELIAPDGTTLLAANDNRAPADPSSLLQVAISAPGDYYLRVTNVSLVVENGHYDIRARIVLNIPPVVSSVTASATAGAAPLRVTLSGTAGDFENAYLDYQWDFDGDGRVDWSSLSGPRVTTTYARPGIYTATLRVVDGAAASDTGSLVITVQPSATPAILIGQDSTGGAAPLTVTFTPSVQGVVPVSYAWDPDGDGIADRTSVTSGPIAFTYREAGTFVPRLVVMDSFGRAFQVPGVPVVVTSAAPPAISLAAGSGNIPYPAALTATTGPAVALDYDVDGDGSPEIADALVFPPESFEVHRAGLFMVKARVTDASGLSATAMAPLTATSIGTGGWMVAPRNGESLGGTSVTLSAEAVPAGTAKSVQFQYRVDSPPGSWIDIGAPIASPGTLFTTSWDVTALPPGSVLDLRILIDGAISSGDAANVVMVHAAAPTWDESGGTLSALPAPGRVQVIRNAAGVWVTVPVGGPASVSIAAASRPVDNGSALGRIPVGAAWRIQVPGALGLPLRLRLPAPVDDATLEVHAYDEGAGVWYRAGVSRVGHDDGWVEAEAFGPGIYALFASPAGLPGEGGGSRFCSAGAVGNPGRGIVVLALGMLICCRRR